MIPIPTKSVSAIICKGDVYTDENGTNYNTTGQYQYQKNGGKCDTLVNLDLLVLDFTVNLYKSNDLSCYNEISNITADIIDNSGNADPNYTFDYLWTTDVGNILSGYGTTEIIVNAPGNYQLLVKVNYNGKECLFSSADIYVDQDIQSPIGNISQIKSLDCSNNLGILSGAESQTPPLQFEWFTQDGNIVGSNIDPILNFDKEGTYYLVVTNLINGCIDTVSYMANRTGFNAVISLTKNADINCLTDTVSINATINPSANYHYQWTTVNGHFVSSDTLKNIIVDKGGTYQLEIINSFGCSVKSTIIVNENKTAPIVKASNDVLLTCAQDSVFLTANVSQPATKYSLLWYSSDGVIKNPTNDSIAVTSPGTYIVQVMDSINYCTSTDTVIVRADINKPDLGNFISDTITCKNPTINITATLNNSIPGLQFNWHTADGNIISGDNTISILVDQVGTYTLVVTNPANNCVDSSNVNIIGSPDQPIADLGSDILLDCNVLSQILVPNFQSTDQPSDLDFGWSTIGGSIDENPITHALTLTTPGTYIFTVTNLLNNCSDSDTILVTQKDDKPIINIDPFNSITCKEDTISIIPNWTNAGNDATVNWSTSNGNITMNSDSIISVDAAGTYVITVVNEESGCISQKSVDVSLNKNAPQISIPVPDELTCAILSVTLKVNYQGNGSFDFSWSTSDGNITSNLNQQQITVNRIGTYTVTVTDTNNGCTTEQSIEVFSAADVINLTAGQDKIINCKIKNVSLDGNVSNPPPGIIYAWSSATGHFISGSNTAIPIVDAPGIYVLEATNPANGCKSTDTVQVLQKITMPNFDKLNASDADCNGIGGEIQFNSIVDGASPYIFFLNNQPVTVSQNTFTNLSPGTYQLRVEDANGCTGIADILIGQLSGITVDLPDTLILERGDHAPIIPLFSTDTSTFTTIEWDGNDLDCANCANNGITGTVNQIIGISIVDKNGCRATDNMYVIVKKKKPKIFVPNVFSPFNHDGINDRLIIQADISTIAKIDVFKIFNRWGAEVFSMYNFAPNDPSTSWDGYYRGKQETPDVFVYYLKAIDINGDEIFLKGDVTIIR